MTGRSVGDLFRHYMETKDYTPEPEDGYWPADVLAAAHFAPVRWVLPGVIPEGLTILAGEPKVGKSWLALDLALGGDCLGEHVPDHDTLYLALEDNPRRLRSRLQAIAAEGAVPTARTTFRTNWADFDHGGVDDLSDYLDARPATKLIIIDTLAKVRGRQGSESYNYQADSLVLAPAHRLANDRGVAVVVVHHTSKGEHASAVAAVSGTFGLAGVADTTVILGAGKLTVVGRDVPETVWNIGRGADEVRWRRRLATDAQRRVLDVLADGPAGVGDLTNLPGVSRMTLTRMVEEGMIVRPERGKYAVTS